MSSFGGFFSATVFINFKASQIGSSWLLFRFACLRGTNTLLWLANDASLSDVSSHGTVGMLLIALGSMA